MRSLIVAAIFLAAFVGLMVLQVYLSKRENRMLGLIMPITSFCLSVFVFLGISLFYYRTLVYTTTNHGEIIERVTQVNIASTVFQLALINFIFFNIPTLGFIAIYLIYRGKKRSRIAIDKMSVQDL